MYICYPSLGIWLIFLKRDCDKNRCLSFETVNVKSPLAKYKITNKATITPLTAVLTFVDICNKRPIIDFQKLQTS